MPWIITDLDGTLTDCQHRLHLLPDLGNREHTPETAGHNAWDAFNRCASQDPVNEAVKHVLWMARNTGNKIAIMTARQIKYCDITMAWLRNHDIPYDTIWMRPNDDRGCSTDLKRNMFKMFCEAQEVTAKDVSFVLEDRDKMVRFWRSLGLACFQVDEGRY